MHLPDGFVSAPVNGAAFVCSAAAIGASLAKARASLGERQLPLLGVAAAFLFAAQMLNFPVGVGTSGHLLGALLVAVLLGPHSAVLVLAVVLLIQCLFFADGGLTALGTNLLNMALIGGLGGYGAFLLLRAMLPRNRAGFLGAAAIAAWFSVVLAAAGCALELALSGTVPLAAALPAMVGIHALIGVGEALITTGVLSVVLSARPDLVYAWPAALPSLAAKEAYS